MSKNHLEIDGKEIRVYRICESDAVAAEWDTDAVEWYKEKTGLEDNDLYEPEDVEILNLDAKIKAGEDSNEEITVREIVEQYWTGEPFIAVTWVDL